MGKKMFCLQCPTLINICYCDVQQNTAYFSQFDQKHKQLNQNKSTMELNYDWKITL